MTSNAYLSVVAAVLFFLGAASAQDTGNVIPFQGQLANQSGQPVSLAGPGTLVFRLYRQPVGGIAFWEESQPNISVNNGRFSVLLGSRTELPSASAFNATLYLGITVDDGNSATADVEMRPRQALVPVSSARNAMNSEKLVGYDWKSIFGTNDPTGAIPASKLADGSIPGVKLVDASLPGIKIQLGSITGSQIASRTISTVQLGAGSVTSAEIAEGAVGSSHLLQSSIPVDRLQPRGQGPGAVGNVQFSSTLVSKVIYAGTGQEIAELTVSVMASGRPVMVGLQWGFAGGVATTLRLNDNTLDGRDNPNVYVNLWRDGGTLIGSRNFAFSGSSDAGYVGVSPEFLTVDFPAAGLVTYRITLDAFGWAQVGTLSGVRLMAFEL